MDLLFYQLGFAGTCSLDFSEIIDQAKELGYNNDARQVGVSAQEVEAIMPEVIADAPINGNFPGADYKTVHYEKLVPLLIEAIKEQQKQIEELKVKLGN